MKYIIGSQSATVFTSRPLTIGTDDPRWGEFVKAIQDGDEARCEAIAATPVVKLALENEQGYSVSDNGDITIDGVPVTGPIQDKLIAMLNEGFDIDNFIKFVRKIRLNPSRRAQEELYKFLEYKALPITEDGNFIAYKGVLHNYWSVRGGEAKLLKGRVNSAGQIYNAVGEEIEVERSYVDDDARVACSQGLHVGSYDYATSWGERTVVVEVNPKDVVSIPFDCNCQKARVCHYTVVSDAEREIVSPVVDESGEVLDSPRSLFYDEIDELLTRWGNEYRTSATVRQIQSALKNGSVFEIRRACEELGWDVEIDEDKPWSVGAMIVHLW